MKYNFVVTLYAMQVPLNQVMVGFHKIAIRIPINDLPDIGLLWNVFGLDVVRVRSILKIYKLILGYRA